MEHTIFGLIKKRGEIAGQHKVAQKAADALKTDLDAIDRALVLCSYEDDPKAITPRGKYKQLFGRNELKLTIFNTLRQAPADDEAIAAGIMEAIYATRMDGEIKGYTVTEIHDSFERDDE
ncbi:hypothetical protein [uncultured Roseobacter sp.]|uniref:hypothetical protein n=1 Tax=uncultured Roseobacter sp. TaxID=114847 RepID=UPI0026163CC8|nr:hypothetical protein [uncultured Roseobacter sp.]